MTIPPKRKLKIIKDALEKHDLAYKCGHCYEDPCSATKFMSELLLAIIKSDDEDHIRRMIE